MAGSEARGSAGLGGTAGGAGAGDDGSAGAAGRMGVGGSTGIGGAGGTAVVRGSAGAGGAAVARGAAGAGGTAGAGGRDPGIGGRDGGHGQAGSIGSSDSGNLAINAAHDGAQPDEAIRTPLTKRWSVNIAGAVSYPLIADGRVFLTYADGATKLAAYALETGTPLWGPLVLASGVWLAYGGGNLFGLDQSGVVRAWDGATGRPLWAATLTMQWSFEYPPVATGGLVYVNGLGFGGTIYAIDGATGALRWTTGYDGGEGAVTIGDGILYEVGGCQEVSAMDALTGQALKVIRLTSCTGGGGGMAVYNQRRIWVLDTVLGDVIIDPTGTRLGSFFGRTPAVQGGTAFYSEENVTAVDVVSGATKWSTPVDGLCTTPIVAGRGGQVFVGSVTGVLHEFDAASGVEVSTHDTGFGGDVNCWPMALAEGRLAYATGTGLVVY